MQLCDQRSQRIKADFISGRKQRTRIQQFVEQKMRRTIDIDSKIARLAINSADGIRELRTERSLRRPRKRWKIQPAICPDAAPHSSGFVLDLAASALKQSASAAWRSSSIL